MTDLSAEQIWHLYSRDIEGTFEHLYHLGAWTKKQVDFLVPEYYAHFKTTYFNKYVAKMTKLKEFALDLSTPVGDEKFTYQGLLESYCFLTICLLISSFNFFLGQSIFSSILPTYYVTLAYLLSSFVLVFFQTRLDVNDDIRRLYLMLWTAADGLLSGCLMFEYSLKHWSLLIISMPMSIGGSAVFTKQLGQEPRFVFLAASLAHGLCFELFFSIIFRQISFLYIVRALFLTAVACLDLQLKIGRLREGNVVNAYDHFISVNLYCICANLWLSVFGEREK